MHKTAAEKAKLAGFASLKQAAAALDLTPMTLRNWHKKHPARFEAAIRGAALGKSIDNNLQVTK